MDRADDRADRTGQEAHRLRLVRSAQRWTAGRRRRREGRRRRDRLGLPPARWAGIGAGTHHRAQPGDRAEAGRHHPRQCRYAGAGARHPACRHARHQDGRLAYRADAGAGQRSTGLHERHDRSTRGREGRGDVRHRRFQRHRERDPFQGQHHDDFHGKDECVRRGDQGMRRMQGPRDGRHADGRSGQSHAEPDDVAPDEVRQTVDLRDRGQRSLL